MYVSKIIKNISCASNYSICDCIRNCFFFFLISHIRNCISKDVFVTLLIDWFCFLSFSSFWVCGCVQILNSATVRIPISIWCQLLWLSTFTSLFTLIYKFNIDLKLVKRRKNKVKIIEDSRVVINSFREIWVVLLICL